MPAVRYYLKSGDKDPKSIYLIYEPYKGQRVKYYIKEKIDSENWNKHAQRPKKGLKFKTLALLLDQTDNFIQEYVLRLKLKGKQINVVDLKQAIKQSLGDNSQQQSIGDLLNYINEEIKRRKESPRYSKGTIKNYNSLVLNLNEYQKYLRAKINFDEINKAWINSFKNYLFNTKGLSTNYVGTLINKLFLFMRSAVEDEVSTNRIYENSKLKEPEKYVPKIYLNDQEILKLYEHKYELYKYRNAVNNFVIDCVIGLRYSDLAQFDIDSHTINIDGNKLIKITQDKTEDIAVIPFNPIIDDIHKNYKVHSISNVKLNLYIKEAAKVAGFTDKVESISYPKGILKKEMVQKWKLITVHTARRSFATNMFKKGVSPRSIMYMTGHKSESQFLKYLRLSHEENAILVAKQLKKIDKYK